MSDHHAMLVPDLREAAPDNLRLVLVGAFAALLVGCAMLLAPPELVRHAMLGAGATLGLVSGAIAVRRRIAQRDRAAARDLIAGFIEWDSVPACVTDSDGVLLARNASAREAFGLADGETLAAMLRGRLASISPLLYRLETRARSAGAAREDVATRTGLLRIGAHRLGDTAFVWRIEDLADPAQTGFGAETPPVPMISVGRSGAVLFMNDAARALVGRRIKSLDRLFERLPVRPGQVQTIGTAHGPVEVAVMETSRTPGRTEFYLLPEGGAEAHREDTFETLPVALLEIAPDGEILRINRMAADLLGDTVSPGARFGQVMQGLRRPAEDWLRDTTRDTDARKSEFLRLKRDDQEVFVQVTLNQTPEAGRAGVIAVLSDATELKTLEAQFVQSQKMQAIGQLAGGVAHDFNNLLTAISGHCDLLLLCHDQGDQDYGDLVQINQNANRAAALVSQLLAFSRKQTLRLEVLDLRDTLSDLTHLLNRLVGEKVKLTLSHDPILRQIRADKRQLEQVLMNLVVNARDAMPQGGEIRIETEVRMLDQPLARDRATVPAGEYVVVKVSDEGIGIAPDKLSKVFEPFYTTKRTGEGTGLGLSTAYGIVKQTGGFIFVDSVVGHGTEFTLFFPAHDGVAEDPAAEPAPAAPVAPRESDGVVLLVEDEAPVRAFASRALQLCGYSVLEAECAEDALRLLSGPDLRVDVFLTDVVMPGMDGPTWVRRALADRPGTRVVFMSGYAEGTLGEADMAVANSVFLPKPFSLKQLTDIVRQQMN